uniref:Ig-like domain-containing protein n=1 Tax=Timema tahoe TaxID=61484 RepID=A0A7R9ICL2_9NEOP|nr:unnamed protein product [Timema tahoe]
MIVSPTGRGFVGPPNDCLSPMGRRFVGPPNYCLSPTGRGFVGPPNDCTPPTGRGFVGPPNYCTSTMGRGFVGPPNDCLSNGTGFRGTTQLLSLSNGTGFRGTTQRLYPSNGTGLCGTTQRFSLSNAVRQYDGETLLLNSIQRSDMGAYLCIASNGIPPSVSKRFIVQVHLMSNALAHPPYDQPYYSRQGLGPYVHPLIKVSNQLVAAPVASDVLIQCYVEASPRAMNSWYRDMGTRSRARSVWPLPNTATWPGAMELLEGEDGRTRKQKKGSEQRSGWEKRVTLGTIERADNVLFDEPETMFIVGVPIFTKRHIGQPLFQGGCLQKISLSLSFHESTLQLFLPSTPNLTLTLFRPDNPHSQWSQSILLGPLFLSPLLPALLCDIDIFSSDTFNEYSIDTFLSIPHPSGAENMEAFCSDFGRVDLRQTDRSFFPTLCHRKSIRADAYHHVGRCILDIIAEGTELYHWEEALLYYCFRVVNLLGEKLIDSDKYSIEEILLNEYSLLMNLTIRNLERRDFGGYLCRAGEELHLAPKTTILPSPAKPDVLKTSRKKPTSHVHDKKKKKKKPKKDDLDDNSEEEEGMDDVGSGMVTTGSLVESRTMQTLLPSASRPPSWILHRNDVVNSSARARQLCLPVWGAVVATLVVAASLATRARC